MPIPDKKTLDRILVELRSRDTKAKAEAQRVRDGSAAGDMPRANIPPLMAQLTQLINNFTNVDLDYPGIVPAAREAWNQSGAFNIETEITNIRTAAEVFRQWMLDNYPKSAGGYTEDRTLLLTGLHAEELFASAETFSVDFRAQADLFLAS